ncbi:nucleotide exchange factor GrpE [Streptomyces sp. NPDC048248]|uniref:nucleotide exchange factor GrpE n=1 Tax=Streptomyces sp. NPDC048248 TaxID=3365523 RepID=UPI003713750C
MSTHDREPEPGPGGQSLDPTPQGAETKIPTEQEQPQPADAKDEHAAALDELQDRWRRALADIDNLRKRHARELERERADERARTAAALLPVVDNLELALAHAGSDPGAIVDGVKAVHEQAVDALRRLGFERHAETGVPFDPANHEVVGVAEAPDAEPGTVVQVIRPGYGDGGHQLRPAAVTVGKRQE